MFSLNITYSLGAITTQQTNKCGSKCFVENRIDYRVNRGRHIAQPETQLNHSR